jgi:hypothetical protein
VSFEPGSVAAQTLARASEHFVVLGATGERTIWATMNAGEVHEVRAGAVVRLADGQRTPVELVAEHGSIAWICRDAPGGSLVVGRTPEDAAPRALAQVAHAWMLAAGEDHSLFVTGAFSGNGALHRVPWRGGRVEEVCALPRLGASMATPRILVSRGEVLLASGTSVLAVPLTGGAPREIVRATLPVRAIAAENDLLALVLGDEDVDRGVWSLARASREGGSAEIVATFARAPYHRHPLVVARGMACTVLGDRLIGVPIG